MGSEVPEGPVVELEEKKQPSGKVITTYAIEGDFDVTTVHSNTFKLEYPRSSGYVQEFPEIDRAAWMNISKAAEKLAKGQIPIIKDCGLPTRTWHP